MGMDPNRWTRRSKRRSGSGWGQAVAARLAERMPVRDRTGWLTTTCLIAPDWIPANYPRDLADHYHERDTREVAQLPDARSLGGDMPGVGTMDDPHPLRVVAQGARMRDRGPAERRTAAG